MQVTLNINPETVLRIAEALESIADALNRAVPVLPNYDTGEPKPGAIFTVNEKDLMEAEVRKDRHDFLGIPEDEPLPEDLDFDAAAAAFDLSEGG